MSHLTCKDHQRMAQTQVSCADQEPVLELSCALNAPLNSSLASAGGESRKSAEAMKCVQWRLVFMVRYVSLRCLLTHLFTALCHFIKETRLVGTSQDQTWRGDKKEKRKKQRKKRLKTSKKNKKKRKEQKVKKVPKSSQKCKKIQKRYKSSENSTV